jgi:hypothetical protein
MWTEGPVLLGLGEHLRGPQWVFDASFAFFNGLWRHDNVNDLSMPQWFRLSLKVIDDAPRVLSFL